MVIRSSYYYNYFIKGIWNNLTVIEIISTKKRGFMNKNLRDLLIDELHDVLSSEEQIVEALPEMVKASESPDLKNAFESHLKETKGQIQRLEKIFKLLKVEKKEKFCKATKGLIQECQEVLKDFKAKSAIRDAALISKAQRIEHYEISAYGTMRAFASDLDLDEVSDLLQATLDEEANADKKLSKIAEGGLFKSGINLQANIPNVKNSKGINKKNNPPKKTKSITPKDINKKISPVKKSKSITKRGSYSLAKR